MALGYLGASTGATAALQGAAHLGKDIKAVVSGATHLFEEPGTLEQVAKLAQNWFVRHL